MLTLKYKLRPKKLTYLFVGLDGVAVDEGFAGRAQVANVPVQPAILLFPTPELAMSPRNVRR